MKGSHTRRHDSPVADPPGGRRLRSRPKGVLRPEAASRQRAIAADAYARAEQRGFTPGGELEDWLQAEAAYDAAHQGDRFAGD